VCVTRIPTAIADSLTANNLRDQRLVARLPRSWPVLPCVPSVADADPAPSVPPLADVGASFVGPVQPPAPLY